MVFDRSIIVVAAATTNRSGRLPVPGPQERAVVSPMGGSQPAKISSFRRDFYSCLLRLRRDPSLYVSRHDCQSQEFWGSVVQFMGAEKPAKLEYAGAAAAAPAPAGAAVLAWAAVTPMAVPAAAAEPAPAPVVATAVARPAARLPLLYTGTFHDAPTLAELLSHAPTGTNFKVHVRDFETYSREYPNADRPGGRCLTKTCTSGPNGYIYHCMWFDDHTDRVAEDELSAALEVCHVANHSLVDALPGRIYIDVNQEVSISFTPSFVGEPSPYWLIAPEARTYG